MRTLMTSIVNRFYPLVFGLKYLRIKEILMSSQLSSVNPPVNAKSSVQYESAYWNGMALKFPLSSGVLNIPDVLDLVPNAKHGVFVRCFPSTSPSASAFAVKGGLPFSVVAQELLAHGHFTKQKHGPIFDILEYAATGAFATRAALSKELKDIMGGFFDEILDPSFKIHVNKLSTSRPGNTYSVRKVNSTFELSVTASSDFLKKSGTWGFTFSAPTSEKDTLVLEAVTVQGVDSNHSYSELLVWDDFYRISWDCDTYYPAELVRHLQNYLQSKGSSVLIRLPDNLSQVSLC